jgi:hypothetical protein
MAILPPQAELPRNRKGLPGGEGQAEGQEGRGLRESQRPVYCVWNSQAPVCRSPKQSANSVHTVGCDFPRLCCLPLSLSGPPQDPDVRPCRASQGLVLAC